MLFLTHPSEPLTRQARLNHYRRHAPFQHLAEPERDEAGQLTHQVWEVQAADGVVHLSIVGPLDPYFGFDPAQIIHRLDAEDNLSRVRMTISSPGGYLELATILYSNLRQRAAQGVAIEGVAQGQVGSAALDLLLAADVRSMDSSTMVMTHPIEAMVLLGGPREDIEHEAANLLSTMDVHIEQNVRMFIQRTGQPDQVVRSWLVQKGETWFNDTAAFSAGLINVKPDDMAEPEPDADPAMTQQTQADRLKHLAQSL